MGAAWLSVIHPDDLERVGRERQSAIDGKTGLVSELRLLHIDGRVFDMQMEAEPDLGADDALRGFAGYLIDVTDAKNAAAIIAQTNIALEAQVADRTRALSETAQELRTEMRRREEMQAELERSRKLETLGELTSGVAHEFNNVLMAITGNLQILQMRNPPPEMVRPIANGLAAASRASRLTEQLLSFTRQINLRPRALRLAGFLADRDDELRQAAGPQIGLAVDVPADLPEVLSDEDQLLSALVNLMLNARDASPQGAQITVSARALAPGSADLPEHLSASGAVALSVRDQGTGMAPDVLSRARDPFFTTKSAGRGTGLGLAMVQAFSEQSGGALRIDSEPGKGTVVCLWLPRAAVEGCVTRLRPLESEYDASLIPERPLGMRILYVDDDYLARAAVADMLRECGAEVAEVDSARAALDALERTTDFDLVITDIDMPGTNGLELADTLVANGNGPPVLLVTGHGLPATSHPVLPKPFTSTELVSHASALLKARQVKEDSSEGARIVARPAAIHRGT
jgi:signal transduction histidine kinase